MDRKPPAHHRGPQWTCNWDTPAPPRNTAATQPDPLGRGLGARRARRRESGCRHERVGGGCPGSNPPFTRKPISRGFWKPRSLSPQPWWPAQCSAFPGEACLPPSQPLPTALQVISSHLPQLPQTAVIQKGSHFQGNQKKKIPGIRGDFNYSTSGSRGALTAPRTQLGAPGIVNTILRGRDINRTYVQGCGEGDAVSPRWKLKLSIIFCCHCCLATGPLQPQKPEKKKKRKHDKMKGAP